MDVVEVNRRLKPGKSRFERHSRKRKTPLSRSGFAYGQKSRTQWNYDMHGRLAKIDDNGSEFSNPTALETSSISGEQRTRIFYCNPYWRRLTKVSAARFFLSHRFARSEKNIADMLNLGELQYVAGEYISPAATSDPPLDRVPALPVEFVPLRGFFSFFVRVNALNTGNFII